MIETIELTLLLMHVFIYIEVEDLFQSIFSIIYILNEECDHKAIIQSIVASITSSSPSAAEKPVKSKLSLKVLIVLFNIVSGWDSKCFVLNGKCYSMVFDLFIRQVII